MSLSLSLSFPSHLIENTHCERGRARHTHEHTNSFDVLEHNAEEEERANIADTSCASLADRENAFTLKAVSVSVC